MRVDLTNMRGFNINFNLNLNMLNMLIMRSGAVSVFLLTACAAPLLPPPVQVQADARLSRAAMEILPAGDATAPMLYLQERIGDNIESLAPDGTASTYKITYTLVFRLNNDEPSNIDVEQVVPVDESRYLAGRRAREEATERLRLEALRQMRSLLAADFAEN